MTAQDRVAERDHVSGKRVLLVLAVSAVLISASIVAVRLLSAGYPPVRARYPMWQPKVGQNASGIAQTVFDRPNHTYRAGATASLPSRYRVIDRERGIAEIPIDVAMDLVARNPGSWGANLCAVDGGEP